MRVTVSAAMAAAQRRKVDAVQRRAAKPKNTSQSGPDLLTEDYDELKKSYQAIQEENLKLQAVITDVTEVNKRWQRYNNDRQMYVDKLLSTIQKQQDQMNKIAGDSSTNLSKQQHPATYEIHKLRQENIKLREELHEVRKQLDEKEREGAALRVQAQVHRDDWEAERAEKFAALQQKEELDKQFRELTMDLRALAQKLREERIHTPIQCPKCGHCLPFEQTFPVPTPVEPCTRRGSLIPRGSCVRSSDEVYLACNEAASNEDFASVKMYNTEYTNDKKFSVSATQTVNTSARFSISGEEAVTVGFNSSGLASVTSFAEHGYSSPIPNGSDSSVLCQSDSQKLSRSSSGESVQSDGGVETQTLTNIICPGCDTVFPSGKHIDFLDHYEVCQQQNVSINKKENHKNTLRCQKCSRVFPAHQQVDFLDHFEQCTWPDKRLSQLSSTNHGFTRR